MDDFFGFLVTVGVIVIAIYANKKKKERRAEELKKAEEERQRQASLGQNKKKHSSNDIVRRRKAQQAEADTSRIHTSIHEKEVAVSQKQSNTIADAVAAKVAAAETKKLEKYDFEDQDLMQEVYDLIAYGYDGSDFLRRLEKENRFQSSLDATINA